MSIEISPVAQSLLARPVLGRLATASPQGQPHVVPVWFLWEEDLLWVSSFSSTRKVIDLEQNPKCALVIDLETASEGLTAVMFEGRAELVSAPREVVKQRIERIYFKYLGPEGILEQDPQSWLNSPENVLIKLTPTRVKPGKPGLLKLLPKMTNHPPLASHQEIDQLNQQALDLRHQDTRQALAISLKAREAALKIDYQRGYASSLFLCSLCRFILAEQVEVSETVFQAQSLFKSLGDLQGQAQVLNLLGNISNRQSNFEEAINYHLQSLQLREEIGDLPGQAGSLNNIGLAYQQMNQLAEALEYLFKSLELSESIGNEIVCAYALCNIAEIFINLGEYSSALQYNQRGLTLVHKTKDRALESTALTTMGRIYTHLGNYETALRYHQESLELSNQTGNLNDKGIAMLGLGISQQENRDYEQALKTLEQALHIIQITKDRSCQAEILSALGKNHLFQNQPQKAIQRLQEALAITKEIGEKNGHDQIHCLLSEAYEKVGDHVLALEQFRSYFAAQQRVFSQDSQRRIRALLARTEIDNAQREATEQRMRNTELSTALQAAQEADREKEHLLRQLATQAEMLKHLAHEDGLTGIANRRWLDLQFAREYERAQRFGHPLAIAMIDVDNFKQVNDQFSHLAGDEVLRTLARLLRDGCRSIDIVGRYGGEEFMLVLVETGLNPAREVCEKLRQKIEAYNWGKIQPKLGQVTISAGLADNQKVNTIEELIAQADKNLYQAKKLGKNQVAI